jgi:hypothetical protein
VHQLREHYKQRSRLSHVLRVSSVQKDVDFGRYFVNLALVRNIDHITREQELLRDKEGAILSRDRGDIMIGCLSNNDTACGRYFRVAERSYPTYRMGKDHWESRYRKDSTNSLTKRVHFCVGSL